LSVLAITSPGRSAGVGGARQPPPLICDERSASDPAISHNKKAHRRNALRLDTDWLERLSCFAWGVLGVRDPGPLLYYRVSHRSAPGCDSRLAARAIPPRRGSASDLQGC
jgi:hypothetical protein